MILLRLTRIPREVNVLANIKSAKKRVLVSETKNLQNRIVKTRMKNAVKKFESAVAANEQAELQTLYRGAVGMVDRAASKGVIHKNAAARKKAQLAKLLQSVNA